MSDDERCTFYDLSIVWQTYILDREDYVEALEKECRQHVEVVKRLVEDKKNASLRLLQLRCYASTVEEERDILLARIKDLEHPNLPYSRPPLAPGMTEIE